MRQSRAFLALITAVFATAAVLLRAQAPGSADTALAAFWAAKDVNAAAAAAASAVKSGVAFDAAYASLQRGRTYSADVPRGVVRLTHHIGPYDFAYLVEVPQNYDPARKYQVRIQLHGGVSREDRSPRGNGIGPLAGAEQIYIMPTAWSDAPWWTELQVKNLRAILEQVKRTYNVDENRVVVAGVSDGGTGSYYFAMRDTTPYASFLPLNGFMMVLANRSNGVEGELFANNLLNKPFFVVNGGMDPLYPASLVEPYVFHLRREGVDLQYTVEPESGHNTSWWPEVKSSFETFVSEHPRQPNPEKLTWESDLSDETRRAHWVVIDELGKSVRIMRDLNDFTAPPLANFGAESAGRRLVNVDPNSRAAALGLRSLDMVTAVNGQELPDGTDVLQYLSRFETRVPLKLSVLRNGSPKEVRGLFDPGERPQSIPLFDHLKPSGRIDLVRSGNTIQATTRGVSAFTLLLSPEVVDFSKPVKVVVDGKTVFEGMVKKSLETLMTWAARDNDRTMLYGAEVHVAVK